MKLLIVSSTSLEVRPLLEYLKENYKQIGELKFQRNELTVEVLITGVGAVNTAYYVTRCISKNNYDFVINAGIAGSFTPRLSIGSVVQVVKERFGDIGAEDMDGSFLDFFDLGLQDPDSYPFKGGWLINKVLEWLFVPPVSGITVNKVHGEERSIREFQSRLPEVSVESMEGAAFFYVCMMEKVSFMELRSISNLVEPRNRDSWNIPLAVDELNKTLQAVIEVFPEKF